MPYRVFISYSQADADDAKVVAGMLRHEHIDFFMFEGSIPAGEEFAPRVRNELQRCAEFCVYWTQNSSRSDWVRFECGGAYALGLWVAPLLGDGMSSVSLPEAFRGLECRRFDELIQYVRDVQNRASADYDMRYLIGPTGGWQIITHCDDDKWLAMKVLGAPGRRLRRTLGLYAGSHTGIDFRILGVPHASPESLGSLVDPDASTVWLLDSPRGNRLVEILLNSYQEWVAGGRVRFLLGEESASASEEIAVDRDQVLRFSSDKHSFAAPSDGAIGPYKDFFLLMCLPGNTLGLRSTKGKVWILCGIHAKGTLAASAVFRRENLPLFLKDIRQQMPDRQVPEYFEAVYEVPNHTDAADENLSYHSLKRVYFSPLQPRSKEATSDEPNWECLPRFASEAGRKTMPLQVAHVDLVAGCNFSCPKCIEAGVRKKRVRFSLRACMDILCSLRRCRCQKIGFYGGEPTIHPSFATILDTAAQMGFEIALVTNGSQLHLPEIRDAIVRNRQRLQVRVSVDANSEETHALVHGTGQSRPFAQIVRAAKELIHDQVHVSISYLLLPGTGNIGELRLACEQWRDCHARQLAIRPMTGPCGVSPAEYSPEECQTVDSVCRTYGDFVSMPAWLSALLKGSRPQQPKAYSMCYSACYRVVISPWLPRGMTGVQSDGADITETERGWLSLCSYRRLDPDFGMELPSNLAAWVRDGRLSAIDKIDPRERCQDVLCCRHTYNERIYEYLARSSGS